MQACDGRIIALTGAHGTGKTTAVFARAEQLKREFPGKTVGILQEVAARCPFPINQEASPKAQMWILAEHLRQELETTTQYDLVVSDRTGFDMAAYSLALGFTDLGKKQAALMMEHHHIYQEIIFHTIANHHHAHEDGRRDVGAGFRQDVESILLGLYWKAGFWNQDRFKIV